MKPRPAELRIRKTLHGKSLRVVTIVPLWRLFDLERSRVQVMIVFSSKSFNHQRVRFTRRQTSTGSGSRVWCFAQILVWRILNDGFLTNQTVVVVVIRCPIMFTHFSSGLALHLSEEEQQKQLLVTGVIFQRRNNTREKHTHFVSSDC